MVQNKKTLRSVVSSRKVRWSLLFLALIVLVFGGLWVYSKVSFELNKRAFEQARVAIDEIYADIAKGVGRPDDSKQSNYCGSFRGVYGSGPTACYLDTSFMYGISDQAESKIFIEKIRNTINLRYDLLKFAPELSTSSQAVMTTPEIGGKITHTYTTKSKLECSVSYLYDPTFDTGLKLEELDKKQLYVSINCSGDSRGDYYPKLKT